MNEKEFLCIIKHKVPEVQKRILSILKEKVEIIDLIERELSANERIQLYGADFPPKKNQEQFAYIILIIKGDADIVREIIGYEGEPYKSPLKSIRYMYGNDKKDNAIDLWKRKQKESVVNNLFPKRQLHVAGLH